MHLEEMKPGQQFMHRRKHYGDRIITYIGFDASDSPSPYVFCVFIAPDIPDTGMDIHTPLICEEDLPQLKYRGYASLSTYLFMREFAKTRWNI